MRATERRNQLPVSVDVNLDQTRSTEFGRSRRPILSWLFVVALAALSGCEGANQSSSWQTAGGPAPTANELVDRVREAYLKAPRYGDRGMLLMTYTQQGSPQQERYPMSTVFDRDVASDLQSFSLRAHWSNQVQHIAVFDPSTQNLGGQIVVRPNLKFEQQCAWPHDSILKHFATGRAELPVGKLNSDNWFSSLPIALARGADEQPWFLGERELLDTSFLDGRECYRLRVNTPSGRCLVWIDVKEYLVLRVELPMNLLDSQLLAQGGVTDPRLVLDLGDAQWGTADLEERLTFSPPADARRVTHFVSLPTPFPSETIGRRPTDAALATLSGQPLETRSFDGQTTVLFWFSSDAICREPLQQFQALAQRMTSPAGPRFLAICTDPPSTLPAQGLESLLRSWRIDPRWVYRDPMQAGKNSFDIRLLPTMEVLGSDGRVQFYKVIDDGQVTTELSAVLSRIAEGHEIASEMRDEYRNYLKLYESQLMEAAFDRNELAAIRNASYAPQRMPEKFVLTAKPLSESTGTLTLKAPGNFGVIANHEATTATPNAAPSSSSTLAVLDGYQSLCLLDSNGLVTQRIGLGTETADNYTQVRGWQQGNQTIWVVGSILGTRLKIIREGQVSATIDVANDAPIRDWMLTDQDGDGAADLWVAHWVQAGLVRYDLQGQVTGKCAMVPNVASVASLAQPGSNQRSIYITSRDAGLYRVSADLTQVVPIELGQWQVAHLFTSPVSEDSQAASAVCLALDPRGTVHAVGLNADLKELWNQPLSSEVFQEQVEFIRYGHLETGSGIWAIARPDGTLHLIDSAGNERDRFQVGYEMQGIALTGHGQTCQLWVSSSLGIERWELGRNSVTARSSTNPTR